jgi:hypothetical protein
VIANVALPKIRATAFALNILIIHALGDVLAFPTLGFIKLATPIDDRVSRRRGDGCQRRVLAVGRKIFGR